MRHTAGNVLIRQTVAGSKGGGSVTTDKDARVFRTVNLIAVNPFSLAPAIKLSVCVALVASDPQSVVILDARAPLTIPAHVSKPQTRQVGVSCELCQHQKVSTYQRSCWQTYQKKITIYPHWRLKDPTTN